MTRTPSLAALAVCLLALSSARPSSFLQRGVGAWRDDLMNHKSAAKRGAAAFALGRIGEDARDAIPDLARKAATDSDPGVREMAASALGEILVALGPAAELQWNRVGDDLRSALKDNDPRVRRGAAYAIGACGKAGSTASDALRERLKDRHPSVRQNAAWALGKQGRADPTTVMDLGDALGDRDSLVRRDAAVALYTLGREPDDRVAANTAKRILDAMRDEKEEEAVRRSLLNALAARVGPDHLSYAPDVLPLAESTDQDTARTAAFVLGKMGAAPELGRVLGRSKDDEVRRICCVTLSHLRGEKGKPGVRALGDALKPTGRPGRLAEEVRELAAEALGQIGFPANEDSFAAVREAIVGDRNQSVRHRCVWALLNVGEPELKKYELVEPLTKVLDEPGDDRRLVRYDSARVLAYGLRDGAPDKAIDALLQMLTDDNLKIFEGSEAEVKGGDESKAGGSKVKAKVKGDARFLACTALAAMGAKAKNDPRVVPALQRASMDADENLKKYSAQALDLLK